MGVMMCCNIGSSTKTGSKAKSVETGVALGNNSLPALLHSTIEAGDVIGTFPLAPPVVGLFDALVQISLLEFIWLFFYLFIRKFLKIF